MYRNDMDRYLQNDEVYETLVGESGVYMTCGAYALQNTIGVDARGHHIQAWTKYKNIHGIKTPFVEYFYHPEYQEHFGEDCTPSKYHPNILIPCPERALVECFRFIDVFTEVYTVFGMYNYLENSFLCNLPKLYAMAEKYKLPKDQLEFWMEDCMSFDEQ